MSDVLQLLLVGGVFFLIMRFGCGSHLFSGKSKGAKSGGHGGGCCGGGHGTKDTPDTPSTHDTPEKIGTSGQIQRGNQPPQKDTDPVCGMEVETKTAKSRAHDGLVYFFCSQDCRETFEASPEKYVVHDSQLKP